MPGRTTDIAIATFARVLVHDLDAPRRRYHSRPPLGSFGGNETMRRGDAGILCRASACAVAGVSRSLSGSKPGSVVNRQQRRAASFWMQMFTLDGEAIPPIAALGVQGRFTGISLLRP